MTESKEEFIDFNHTKFSNEKSAATALDALIKKYKTYQFKMFQLFENFLKYIPILLSNLLLLYKSEGKQ